MASSHSGAGAGPAPGQVPLLPIVLLATASFASSSAFRIADPVLPTLALEFGTDLAGVSPVVTWFAIAYGLSQFAYGPLGDRLDKYRVIRAATLLCCAASLGAALAPSVEVLFVFRFLGGLAGAGIIPLGMAWIGDHVPYEKRQATLARFILGAIIGLATGQSIGGVLGDTLGWRAAFMCLAALYLTVGALMWLHRPAPRRREETGAGFLRPFGVVARAPLARWLLPVVFLEGAVVFGAFAFVPAMLQQRFGVSMMASGMTGVMFAAGGIAYAIAAPRLLGRYGQLGLVRRGGVLLGVAFALYWAAGSAAWAMLASVALGLGYYLVHGTLQTLATQLAPSARGTAVSLFAAVFFCGQSAGVYLVSRLDAAGLLGALMLCLAFVTPAGVLWLGARLLRRAASARG